MNSTAFKKGLHDGVPIGLGYFAVSFTFGMMAVAGGISIAAAVLIALTNLTSAGQFAGIGIIFASGSLWEMALTQLVINLRYCLMSFSLSQKLERGVSTGHRLAVAFGVTDEIFGVSASQEGRVSPWYNYGVMAVAIPATSTVVMMITNPAETLFRTGTTAKMVLTAIAPITTPNIALFFFAGGMMTARNIP